jgi:hypothetical protein
VRVAVVLWAALSLIALGCGAGIDTTCGGLCVERDGGVALDVAVRDARGATDTVETSTSDTSTTTSETETDTSSTSEETETDTETEETPDAGFFDGGFFDDGGFDDASFDDGGSDDAGSDDGGECTANCPPGASCDDPSECASGRCHQGQCK